MKRRARLSCHRLDPVAAGPLLEKVMPVGGDDAPREVLGYRDAGKRLRRVVADYPNGWRLSFSISIRGVIGRVSARLKLVAQSTTLGEVP